MPYPSILARALLLVFALLALLAAPMAFVLVDSAQPSDSPSPVAQVGVRAGEHQASIAHAAPKGAQYQPTLRIPGPRGPWTATGTTPEYAGAHMASLPRPAPVRLPATNIVISEFRSRGPAGATFPDTDADEFIELFNPTVGSISLDGWSLWRSTCAGAESLIIGFSGLTIPAGGHYLLGGLEYSGLVTPEPPLVDIGLDDDGGLALRSGPLVTSSIVDQVGMCDSGGYFDPPAVAPFTADLDRSYDRNIEPGGICTDNDTNGSDFFLRTPSDPQNSSSSLTICGNPTPTPTTTNTPSTTPTPLCTVPSAYPALSALINEVAWSGTQADPTHEWIELYNPDSLCTLKLQGWRLFGIRSGGDISFEILFDSTDDIVEGGYFIIAPGVDVFQNVTVDRDLSARGPVSGSGFGLIDSGMILYLRGPHDELVDNANFTSSTVNVSTWPAGTAGSAVNRRTMERYRLLPDTRANWVTFNGDTSFAGWPTDEDGNRVKGTPRQANWAFSVTVTPSPVPTKGRTPTPVPPTPFAHMVINEFLPRAGTDWNRDGEINVYDEFIEIKNNGPIDGDLASWKLDDVADGGSPMFTLPSVKLKPGGRAVFYGLQTRLLLEDSGDTVRLVDPRGIVIDARGYGVIKNVNESHCRLPDGYYWRHPCFATPGNENALTGAAPAPAPIPLSAPPPCLLADTVPSSFREAECSGFGSEVYDRTYWEEPAPEPPFGVEDPQHKWKTTIE